MDRPRVRYIRERVDVAEDAEDLIAQVFLAAYQALSRYRHRGRFGGWLLTIARNQEAMHRRKSRREFSLEDTDDKPAAGEDPDPQADPGELRRLRILLRRLPDHERELIRLRYVAEIAETPGKREEAVKKSLYRLQLRLQKEGEASHD